MEHINVFISIFSVLMIIMIAIVIIGCTIASGIADDKIKEMQCKADKAMDYSKFCDDYCISCTAYDTCRLRDGKIREV
ncbi:MAG: hypothetical protein Q8936_23355 [Bacillota bacterium]|nr:hypothetical protein [Bacillota bacterium]